MSGCVFSLIVQLSIDLPSLNLISKIDLLETYEDLQMPIEFYLNCTDFEYLDFEKEEKKTNFGKKNANLVKKFADVIQDCG